jgi:hypothetical protein
MRRESVGFTEDTKASRLGAPGLTYACACMVLCGLMCACVRVCVCARARVRVSLRICEFMCAVLNKTTGSILYIIPMRGLCAFPCSAYRKVPDAGPEGEAACAGN